ncbi:MAG: 1-(5-phosphoribosyl)-5-[(5-phosphoribosylamino)methylideneamino] imidazole-4-carboxamide isomerase [Polyangiaceae bacterium]
MKIIPAIDLIEGRVVRLRQGRFDDVTHYDEDPAELARMFRHHTDRLHVVDLDGARAGKPMQLSVIRRISAAFGPGVQIGGGLRDEQTILTALSAGHRAVVGTAAIRDPDMVRTLCQRHPGRVIVAVDARDDHVMVAGWAEDARMSVDDLVTRLGDWPLGGILFTDIARDGLEHGPNVTATSALAQRTAVEVIASGGVGSLEHIRALASAPGPIAAVVLGRALHEGRFGLEEAVQAGQMA